MSRTTESIHIRGARRGRVTAAIDERMRLLGYRRVARTKEDLGERRRIILRREGKWLSFVDDAGTDLRKWGEHLSRALERSVLTLWTWDGEASVVATRWREGQPRHVLTLLDDAFRGSDGLAYAPAKVLWPWIQSAQREAILARGIALMMPSATTGDDELDELLEGFDEDDSQGDTPLEQEEGSVFVNEHVSVLAIAATVGMRNPWIDTNSPRAGDRELIYLRT
jgi:hypothetical protein